MLGGTPEGRCAILEDEWSWSGSSWQQVARTLPFDPYHTALAYLPEKNQAVLYSRGHQTWIWNGTTWSPTPASGPTETYGGECSDDPSTVFGLVDSPSMHSLLLVGNLNLINSSQSAYEVWAWDGAAWSKKWPTTTSTPSPPNLLEPAVGWDPVSSRLILFGGIKTMSPDPAPNDTWAWDGRNWSRLSPAIVPPSNNGGQKIALDPTAGRLLMLDEAQTWSWTGSNWQKLADGLPGPTPNIDGGALASDPVNRQVIYVGGCTVGCVQLYPGTLVWDGKSWSLH